MKANLYFDQEINRVLAENTRKLKFNFDVEELLYHPNQMPCKVAGVSGIDWENPEVLRTEELKVDRYLTQLIRGWSQDNRNFCVSCCLSIGNSDSLFCNDSQCQVGTFNEEEAIEDYYTHSLPDVDGIPVTYNTYATLYSRRY